MPPEVATLLDRFDLCEAEAARHAIHLANLEDYVEEIIKVESKLQDDDAAAADSTTTVVDEFSGFLQLQNVGGSTAPCLKPVADALALNKANESPAVLGWLPDDWRPLPKSGVIKARYVDSLHKAFGVADRRVTAANALAQFKKYCTSKNITYQDVQYDPRRPKPARADKRLSPEIVKIQETLQKDPSLPGRLFGTMEWDADKTPFTSIKTKPAK